ncbi:MAG: N-acetyltransferase, partial [Dehalococcoidia bacterium]
RFWEMRLKDPSQVPPPRIHEDFTLRSFVDGDEKALTEIHNLAFSHHWGFSPNTVEEIGYRARMGFCRPEGILLITHDGKAVGFCWTRMEEGPRGVTGFISMMGTHPEYRGRGLGEAVMRVGVAYLRGAGVARVDLTVDSQNPSAIKIYRAGGFERRAVTLWYERSP